MSTWTRVDMQMRVDRGALHGPWHVGYPVDTASDIEQDEHKGLGMHTHGMEPWTVRSTVARRRDQGR